MHKEVRLPDLGADAKQPIVISVWLVELGEEVVEGDRIVEVLVGSATFDVSAPASGRLVEVRADIDEQVRVGDVLGVIEVAEATDPLR